MGTVHAKSETATFSGGGGGSGGLFEFEEPIEIERDIPKQNIRLDGVRARVDRVHVDGLNRTKDDVIRSTVDELFQATDFEDVIIKAHKVRRALSSLGCFRDVGVFIDVSSGPAATPDGLEVTFQVKELSRIVGGVNTTVSENEGNLVFGILTNNSLSAPLQELQKEKAFHRIPKADLSLKSTTLAQCRLVDSHNNHPSVKLPNVLGRGEKVSAQYSMGYRSSSNYSLELTKPCPHRPLMPVISASLYQQAHEYPWSGYKLLDRGLLMALAFSTSPTTKHKLEWEGMVRETGVLSKTTPFKVRESSGPQMKSILRHTVTVDSRDEATFPSRGAVVSFTSEAGGLGGGVAQLRAELRAEANVKAAGTVLQVTGAAGVLHDLFGTAIADHFFLGGPTTLRGFKQRGAGPHADGYALGGKMYMAGGLHLYCGLPFVSNRGVVSELLRTHLFVNAGTIASDEEDISVPRLLSDVRISIGAGVAARIAGVARLELNYAIPVRAIRGDGVAPGLQFGLGATFL